jgi:bacteriorhodopsin
VRRHVVLALSLLACLPIPIAFSTTALVVLGNGRPIWIWVTLCVMGLLAALIFFSSTRAKSVGVLAAAVVVQYALALYFIYTRLQ